MKKKEPRVVVLEVRVLIDGREIVMRDMGQSFREDPPSIDTQTCTDRENRVMWKIQEWMRSQGFKAPSERDRTRMDQKKRER